MKKYFTYRGKYSGIHRIAAAEDMQTVSALLAEGWTRTTLAEVRVLRRAHSATYKTAKAYIDTEGALVITD